MKRAVLLLGLCGALACPLLAADARAQAIPNKGRIMIYGSAGASRWNMTDVNDVLRNFEDELRQDFVLANYEVFVSAPNLGAGLYYQLTKRLGVGADYVYAKQDLQNDTFAESGARLLDEIDTWVKDFQLQVYYWPPIDDGLFVGGGLGAGWMWARQELQLTQPGTDPQTFLGDWTANQPTFGAFAGYQFNFIWGLHLYLKGGYNWMNMGMPTGGEQRGTPGQVEDFDLPINNVDWDYSGFFARVQLGIGFFGKRDDS